MKKNTVILSLYIGLLSSLAMGGVTVTGIEPTVFFPVQEDKVSRQLYRVHIDNDSDDEADVQLQCVIEGKTVTGDCKAPANSRTAVELAVPEITKATQATITIVDSVGAVLDSKTIEVTPQKKWKLYCATVSHQDLGFIDYYQLVRRHVREEGIDMALEYCSLTDDWPHESKFRWNIETSEGIIQWVNKRSPEKVAEFVRRIKEGRIFCGAIHNSLSTEMAGYEVLARSLYTPNRYVVDFLGIEPSKVALIDDVPGFTRSLPLYFAEAQIPYFMHGSNHPNGLSEAINEPVFNWVSPDNDKKVMVRTDSYYSPNRIRAWDRKEMKRIVDRHVEIDWKYDCILAFDSEDFIVPYMENAENIREWNKKWAYPQVICATMDMFFEDISSQIVPGDIKSYDKDAPDAWADQDITDASLLAKAREITERVPTAEKFSTFAMALSGGYPEKDIWQAYNRMVMYHEHTNAAIDGGRPAYYETEKVMHGTLVDEAGDFSEKALTSSIADISSLIKTEGDTLVVYNPLNWQRNDTVFVETLEGNAVLTDNVTGDKIKCQKLVNGKYVFVAENVPSLGYKTFAVGKKGSPIPHSVISNETVCENDFYRIKMDNERNIISSIVDKSTNREILDHDSPYLLGEYLYYEHTGKTLNRSVFKEIAYYKGDVVDEIHITQDTLDTTDLKLIVYAYNNVNRIDFDMQLNKLSNGNTLQSYNRSLKEAMFCAIPLKVSDYQFNHELSGAVVQPAGNQFEGSETAFFAIQHFTDVSNPEHGVTLSTKDTPVVIYGHPRVAHWDWNVDHESIMQKPSSSSIFLYLMNNMFFTNIRFDQPGEKRFRWSLRGHEGDWREGKAYQFGWDTSNALFANRIDENVNGILNGKMHSFVKVDAENVVCSTVKPAEANGSGYILRFYEVSGKDTTVNVTASFLDKIDTAVATSLIENDLLPVKITSDNSFSFDIKGSGLKTIRITSKPKISPIKNLQQKAVSDMRIDLEWSAPKSKEISHYAVYRGLSPEFKVGSSSFVGTSKGTKFTDMPELNFGGWPNNVLEPDTRYYYKVCAVDRSNNRSEMSDVVASKTLKASQINEKPLQVKGLYGVHVSPNGPDNYVNLWFYTSCEPDVSVYEIYRGAEVDFNPNSNNKIGMIDAENEIEKYYNIVPYSKKELNRQMFSDKTANGNTVYYYKVCAVDNKGLRGDFSEPLKIEMSVPELVIHSDISSDINSLSTTANIEIRSNNPNDEIYYTSDGSKPTKESVSYTSSFVIDHSCTIRAAVYSKGSEEPNWIISKHFALNSVFSQSSYGSGYVADRAIDGIPSPDSSWISSPYGGVAKENALDVWFLLLLPNSVELKGLYLIGDDREVVATMDKFDLYLRNNNDWTLQSSVEHNDGLPKNHFKINFAETITADAVKILFNRNALPFSDDKGEDGVVRISELKFILADGGEVNYSQLIEMSEPQLVIHSDLGSDIESLSAKPNVEIHWSNSNDEIYYTLDGSGPTKESVSYTSSFAIDHPCTIRAAVYTKDSEDPISITSKDIVLNSAFSQSNWGSGYTADKAIDGIVNQAASWISSPYGGGTKESSRDIWFVALLPNPVELKGLYLIGDDREVVATMDKFDLYLRSNNEWTLQSAVEHNKKLTKNHFEIKFDKTTTADAVKILFDKNALPFSDNKGEDGIARIAELRFILTDGSFVTYKELK